MLTSCGETENAFSGVRVSAQVPGEVHMSLLRAGVLKEDPLYRFNEQEMSDVARNCWAYTLSGFSFPAVSSSSPEDMFLHFAYIDTSAKVTLNGRLLGSARNAHRTQSWLVPYDMIKHDNTNVLSVEIASAVLVAAAGQKMYPYSVPHTLNYNVWTEPSHRNFMRKAGSDFGWDWGPAYVPAGIGSVRCVLVTAKEGWLDSFTVQTTLSADLSSAELRIFAYFDKAQQPPTSGHFQVFIEGKLELEAQASDCVPSAASPHAGLFVGSWNTAHPRLWWPRGHGEQPLYAVELKYVTARKVVSLYKRVGLRSVRLVESADTDTSATNAVTGSRGKSAKTAADGSCLMSQPAPTPAAFYFEINNTPIFMRGANFIPLSVFSTQVTAADRAYLLKVAADSNMNMLRIWGGGTTQPDDLYDLADEMGILLWQELLFACAMYPTNSEFLAEVAVEVQEQARRLSSHPSIVVFGGNNENEVALDWFTESQQNRDLFVSDYTKLYANTAFPALMSVISMSAVSTSGTGSTFAWVDSSPSSGLYATNPYAKRWSAASTAVAGDVHFYDYLMDCEDAAAFPAARFVSEFGFQGQPSFLAYSEVTLPEDWSRVSPLLQFRQRHENGDEQMLAQASRHFEIREETPSTSASDTIKAQELGDYFYLLQVQQARCYETAINRWRQLQTLEGQRHTMGILYWQLNDIWQGPSWASMENKGRFRVLQYAVRRAFNPLSVSFSGVASLSSPGAATAAAASQTNSTSPSSAVSVWAVNDLPVAQSVHVTIYAESWSNAVAPRVLWKTETPAVVDASSSLQLASLTVTDSQLQKVSCARNTCYLRAVTRYDATGAVAAAKVPDSFYWLSQFKDAELTQHPAISISKVQIVSDHLVSFDLQVDASSPFLWLEVASKDQKNHSGFIAGQQGVYGDVAGWFSDNGFLARAKDVYSMTYTSHLPQTFKTAQEFRDKLQFRTLQAAQAKKE